MIQGGDGIATPGHAQYRSRASQVSGSLCHVGRTRIKGLNLEGAQGAVPDQGAAVREAQRNVLRCPWTDVEDHLVGQHPGAGVADDAGLRDLLGERAPVEGRAADDGEGLVIEAIAREAGVDPALVAVPLLVEDIATGS